MHSSSSALEAALAELQSRKGSSSRDEPGSTKGTLSKALTRREYSEKERQERHQKRAYVRNAEYVAEVKSRRSTQLDQ